MMNIKTRIEILKSRSGVPYLGVIVNPEHIEKCLFKMNELTGIHFAKLRENRFARDGKDHHITLIDPREYSYIAEADLRKLTGVFVDFQLAGLGRVEKNKNIAYYIVASSPNGDDIRESLSLGVRDFHVTLGFKEKDVHGVGKGPDTLVFNEHYNGT